MTVPIQIDVTNEQSMLSVDEPRLAKIARQILQDAGVRGGTLSIAVVDDNTIHRVNNEFLRHDYPTDVLSFVLEEDRGHFEGEVIVSAETAIRNAAEYIWDPEDELVLYVTHGTLHLAGFRDKTEAEQAAMRDAETRYLRLHGIRPPVSAGGHVGSAEAGATSTTREGA